MNNINEIKKSLSPKYSEKHVKPYNGDGHSPVNGNFTQFYNKGIAFYKQGKYDQAGKEFEKAFELKPNDVYTLYGLGNTYYCKAKYEDAVKVYTKAININPDYAKVHYSLSLAYSKLGMTREAEKQKSIFRKLSQGGKETIQKHAKSHNNVSHSPTTFIFSQFYKKGTKLYKQGNYIQAEKEFKKAIDLNPDDFHALYGLGNTYYCQTKYDEAVKAYIKTINIKPEFASVHYSLSLAYNKLGMTLEAEEQKAIFRKRTQAGYSVSQHHTLHTCVDHTPGTGNFSQFYNKGIEFYKNGNYDCGGKEFEKALELKPNDVYALYGLGNTYYCKAMYKDAVKVYSKVININPDHSKAHYSLSLAYSKLGMTREAEKEKAMFRILSQGGRTTQKHAKSHNCVSHSTKTALHKCKHLRTHSTQEEITDTTRPQCKHIKKS